MKKTGTYRILATAALLLLFFQGALSQRIALKTNLLYDAATVPSLGCEAVLDSTYSVSLTAAYNPFSFGDKKWKLWAVSPEIRRWQCLPLTGGFVGAAPVIGGFNIQDVGFLGLGGRRAQGSFFGAGLTCGWHAILSSHWSMEFGLGAALLHISYTRYLKGACGYREKDHSYFSVLPFHTGVTLVYIIR